MSKVRNLLTILLSAVFILTFAVWEILSPDKEVSKVERRKLQSFPTLSKSTVFSGEFMESFDKYSTDQFPLRDGFRTMKALTAYYPLNLSDNNDFYTFDGYIIKMEYPQDNESITHATDRFKLIYDKYLKDSKTNIYLSVIPDKNYFTADSGHLKMDYESFIKTVRDDMDYAQYIDIFPTLELEDYYKTDTHWRQENLRDTADVLAQNMGVTLNASYKINKVDTPFYGVYYGHSALTYLPADELYYLTNDTLESCVITDLETNTEIPLYDISKCQDTDSSRVPDPYDMFLSGPNRSIITAENPNATTDKELVIIRDSYANSLSPLLFEAYKKVTLVDIRKVHPQHIGTVIDFSTQDVLFLQSILVLNDSSEVR